MWTTIFVFSHNPELWVLINVSGVLKHLNAILVDHNALKKVQFYFWLFILGWATFFVFSLNPKFWVLIDVLDILKNINALLVDPNA